MARYELFERIGVGGMAEIFRGRAVAGGGFEKPVAIKRILPHLSQDPKFVAMLIAEANTLSRLRHRNVVQIYDVGIAEDGGYFLVMEYVDGSDLGAVHNGLMRSNQAFPLDVALHIGMEVCDALEHAYRTRDEKGQPLALVHRDISPENILLSRSGEVKLTDFGLAKRTEEMTGHGTLKGKFGYVAPEQSHGRKVDARSDVFSLGVVLYELATGTRLFSALKDFEALNAVRSGNVPRPRSVNNRIGEELEQILLKALEVEPDRRFASAADFGAAIRNHRYTQSGAAVDPATEIGDLVRSWAEERYESPADEFGEEATVLRIVTAAGFDTTGLVQSLASDGPDANTRIESVEHTGKTTAFTRAEEANSVTVDTAVTMASPVAPPSAPGLAPMAEEEGSLAFAPTVAMARDGRGPLGPEQFPFPAEEPPPRRWLGPLAVLGAAAVGMLAALAILKMAYGTAGEEASEEDRVASPTSMEPPAKPDLVKPAAIDSAAVTNDGPILDAISGTDWATPNEAAAPVAKKKKKKRSPKARRRPGR